MGTSPGIGGLVPMTPTPSIWPSLIGAGLQGLASYQQSRAANNAAQQMVDASNRALDFSRLIYGEQRQNQAPFIGVGQGAVMTLADLLRMPRTS